MTSGFGLDHLPYGVAVLDGRPQVVTRIGDRVLPVAEALDDRLGPLVEGPVLNPLLAAGPSVWAEVREALQAYLTNPPHERALSSVNEVELRLPIAVGDIVDFYASLDHATNLGRILRPDTEPLLPNWRHLPVGYHGRSASVIVSGTPVRRPSGLVATGEAVVRRPTTQLDYELEVGFVVGPGNEPGVPIPVDAAANHVFGAVLVNDWSARDLQAFEYQPLGPFLGKSFATSVSAWVTPLAALEPFLVEPPVQEPPPDPALRAERPWGLDIELGVELNGLVVARTGFRATYWTFAQQLAHLTSNGAVTRPGDLFASGTVSGPGPQERGSLIERTWRGRDPIELPDGRTRTWLEDGDEVVLRAEARRDDHHITMGEAAGVMLAPARREEPL
jgi:fumarylacetoacetase